jgi:hypothetical protein
LGDDGTWEGMPTSRWNNKDMSILRAQVSTMFDVFQHFSIGVQHGGTMVAWVRWLLLHEIWMNCCFWNSMGRHLFYKQDLETPNDISTFT